MFQNILTPPPKKKSLTTDLFVFKPNATTNYHDSRWCNNERDHLDSCFSS